MNRYTRAAQETPYVGPLWWHAALWLLAALIFQLTVARFLAFRGAAPSAVLVVVVWYAIRVDVRRAGSFGLAAGICTDLLSTGTGGAWTVATTLVAIFAALLSRNFFADSLTLAAAVAAVATLLRNGIFWAMMGWQGYPAGLGSIHLHEALWEALLNAILMVLGTLLARRAGLYARR